MKKRWAVLLLTSALLLGLCACGKKEAEAVPTPPPSVEPTTTATPTPTPTPTPAPTPIVFPTNVERTFSGMMGIYDVKSETPQDALCYDAMCYYYRRYGGDKYSPTLYSLAMLDDATYTDEDGNINYVGMMAQYGYYDLGLRLPQGMEPSHSNPLYPNFQPIRFVVDSSGDEDWCVKVVSLWEWNGDPTQRAGQVFGEPNAALFETYIEKGFETDWLRDMARPVTPIDPEELLTQYLEVAAQLEE